MKKNLSKLLLFFLCISFFVIIPNKANAAEIIPLNISVQYGQTEARTILDMINEMRTSNYDAWYWNMDDTTKTTYDNLSELTYDYDLERIAMKRAAEIALSYDHKRPNGEKCFSLYPEEGVIGYRTAGENIAAGQTSAAEVNLAWREDNENYAGQGHRRNMLNQNFNCVGIGHVYYNGCDYRVEEFAYRTSVNTTETPANDSEQTVTLSVDKNGITSIEAKCDKTSYILKPGETVEPNITASITFVNHWGYILREPVTDIPDISVTDSSIATYSDGKISGIKEGTTTLTASLYGLTITDMPTITVHECDNHWNEVEITTEPTCIKEGVKTFTCSICGDTKTETVSKAADKHLHSEIRDKKDATCKDEGYTGDTYCTDCGKKISSGKSIAKTETHSYDDGKITTEPTCTKRGTKTFTCTICGNTKTETVKATGHSYGEYKIVKEPTSTKDGLKSRTCTVCGKVESVRIAKTASNQQNTNTSDTKSNTKTSQKTTKKIKLNRTKLTLKKGWIFRLRVTLTPINSRDKIIYKTSNKKIVTVSKTGKIKAIRKGKANITVISGKKKIVCKVTVK